MKDGIFKQRVGKTPLVRARSLEESLGLNNIYFMWTSPTRRPFASTRRWVFKGSTFACCTWGRTRPYSGLFPVFGLHRMRLWYTLHPESGSPDEE